MWKMYMNEIHYLLVMPNKGGNRHHFFSKTQYKVFRVDVLWSCNIIQKYLPRISTKCYTSRTLMHVMLYTELS